MSARNGLRYGLLGLGLVQRRRARQGSDAGVGV